MALLASLLASIASGTIGSFVVIKRIAFIAGAISHSILGGMGLCLWLQRSYGIQWLDPLFGAFAGSIGSAMLLGWIHLNYRQREDAVIAAIWSTGMAIGVIFISLTPGTNVELMNFLFGNILWINTRDLIFLGILDIFILGFIFFYYRRFLAICFDEEQALLRGIPVRRLYMLLLSLVAVTVVLLIQVIGTVLVIALLTIPATLAGLFTNRLACDDRQRRRSLRPVQLLRPRSLLSARLASRLYDRPPCGPCLFRDPRPEKKKIWLAFRRLKTIDTAF